MVMALSWAGNFRGRLDSRYGNRGDVLRDRRYANRHPSCTASIEIETLSTPSAGKLICSPACRVPVSEKRRVMFWRGH